MIQPSNAEPTLAPNAEAFLNSYDDVWKATTSVIQFHYLMPIDISIRAQGLFSTRWVTDPISPRERRTRVSGSFQPSPPNIVVTLSKQEEVFANGVWKSVQSDFSMEKNMLAKIREVLANTPNRTSSPR